MVRLTASDIHEYYRPCKCGLRVTLREHGEKAAASGPYEQVLERLGREHENRHLQAFRGFADARGGVVKERVRRTQEYVQNRASAIYQGVLRTETTLAG